MTPEELGELHPKLYHVTAAGAARNIFEHGLLSTERVLDLWEVDAVRKSDLLAKRRPRPELFVHFRLGAIIVNDNAPLSESKLAGVLDDGLTVSDWLRMLSSRVFFFPDWMLVQRLLGARLNRSVAKDILVVDTRRLAEAYAAVMEFAPFNTGNTTYTPVRRGRATFAPLLGTDYDRWRWLRGNKSPDSIKEVSVRGSILDIADFVLEVRAV